jgi:hypothetical protein
LTTLRYRENASSEWKELSLGGQLTGIEVLVTAPAGGVINYTDDITSNTATVGSDGTATISLPNYGTWKFSLTLNGATTSPVSLVVDDVKQYSLGINCANITITAPADTTLYWTGQATGSAAIGTDGTYLLRVAALGTYNFYAQNSEGVKTSVQSVTVEDCTDYTVAVSFGVTYGVIINTSNSDPAASVAYTEDATGMTSGWSNWADKDLFKDIKPCILTSSGTVSTYLNRDNFTKTESGSTATLTSIGNDVMIEFPKMGYKITKSGNNITVLVTNEANKDGFCYLAHSLSSENDCDYIYIGAYDAYTSSSKLYSVSGQSPTVSTTLTNFRTYATNRGTGYQLMSFYPWTLLQCLYLIVYKNLNGQSALGQGYVGGSAAQTSGQTNSNTFCYGSTSTTQVMKFLGIENMWGNVRQWLDGFYCDSSRNATVAWKSFSDTGSGYTNGGSTGFTSNTNNYISSVLGTNNGGFFPNGLSGSSTTYFCDYGRVCASCCADVSGSWGNGGLAGPFYFYAYGAASDSGAYLGARLLYKHKA